VSGQVTGQVSDVAEQAPPAVAAPRGQRVSVTAATVRAAYIIWFRDVLRFWRDRNRFFFSLVQPLLYLVIFGTGLSSSLRGLGGGASGGVAGSGLTYQQFLYPGVISMSVLFSAIFGAMSIVWDREFGFLKEILVAPINRGAVAVGKTLGGATQSMVQGLILLVLAPLVGVTLSWQSVVALIPLVFVLAFALSAGGVALGARMRSMQGFQVVMNLLMMPLFFLSGALFALRGLPGWMTLLTRLDPASYGVDPIRRVVLSGAGVPAPLLDRLGLDWGGHVLSLGVEVAVTLAFGVVMLAIAIFNFQQRD
jgi:ABC-2 type transport system permease protein